MFTFIIFIDHALIEHDLYTENSSYSRAILSEYLEHLDVSRTLLYFKKHLNVSCTLLYLKLHLVVSLKLTLDASGFPLPFSAFILDLLPNSID